jgi:hypothetical protein
MHSPQPCRSRNASVAFTFSNAGVPARSRRIHSVPASDAGAEFCLDALVVGLCVEGHPITTKARNAVPTRDLALFKVFLLRNMRPISRTRKRCEIVPALPRGGERVYSWANQGCAESSGPSNGNCRRSRRSCILTVNSLDSTTNLNQSRTLMRIGFRAGDVISAVPCAYAATSVTYSAAFPECSCSS